MITLRLKMNGEEIKASFDFSRKHDTIIIEAIGEEDVHAQIEISLDDFNNACLDLFNYNKRLNGQKEKI